MFASLHTPLTSYLDPADVSLRTLHNRLIDDFVRDPDSLDVYLLLNELYAQTLDRIPVTIKVSTKVEIDSRALLARRDKKVNRFSSDFARASTDQQKEMLINCAIRYFSVQSIPIVHRQLQYHRPCVAEVRLPSGAYTSLPTIGYLDAIYPYSLLIAPLPVSPDRYAVPMSVVLAVSDAIRSFRNFI